MPPKPLILVIGSSNVDMIMKLPRLPKLGETVTDGAFIQTFGGKGANQAVAASLTGGNVSFVNCVGDDNLGEQVITNLKKNKVDVTHVFKEKNVATGTALVMIGEAGTNYLAVAPGANYKLTKSHIAGIEKIIEAAEWVILQFEIPEDTLYYTLDVCARKGKKVIFNLAPPRNIETSYLKKIHTFMVNETEAEFLINQKVETPQQILDAAKKIQALGPEEVIITLGAKGSFVYSKTIARHIPTFKVKALDTTAAGDTFCGAFATAYTEGKSTEDAIIFASAASALSVTKLGAQPSIPNREMIDQFMLTNHLE
ncbi:MAG: ribokinase [Bacteroidota bacterium]|nr:ribokinase [Bacteroidota bacterium]